MKSREEDIAVEKLSLLPDRYYIILNKSDEDSFSLTAYDTTGSYDKNEIPCAAAIAQEGILEMMDMDLPTIIKLGMLRIKNSDLQLNDNVIKVDFGRKQ